MAFPQLGRMIGLAMFHGFIWGMSVDICFARMQSMDLSSLSLATSAIHLALAPAFLLSAVVTLLGAIAGRLARNVDRMRYLQGQLLDEKGIPKVLAAHYRKELREFRFRGRLGTSAIFADVLSGVLVCLSILELFGHVIAERVVMPNLVIVTFASGLLFFLASLLLILVEVVIAYRSASWDVPLQHEESWRSQQEPQ